MKAERRVQWLSSCNLWSLGEMSGAGLAILRSVEWSYKLAAKVGGRSRWKSELVAKAERRA